MFYVPVYILFSWPVKFWKFAHLLKTQKSTAPKNQTTGSAGFGAKTSGFSGFNAYLGKRTIILIMSKKQKHCQSILHIVSEFDNDQFINSRVTAFLSYPTFIYFAKFVVDNNYRRLCKMSLISTVNTFLHAK